jgi:uncharacterized protein
MRYRVAFLLFAFALGAPAQEKPEAAPAVEPAKMVQIQEYLTLTKADQLMQQMLGQYENIFNQQIGKSLSALPKGADQAAVENEVEEFQKRLFGVIRDQLSYDRVKPALIKVYDESFTTDELTGINAFYRSSAGQAYLAKIPQVTQRAMEAGSNLVGGAAPEIQKMTAAWIEEMKKKYGNSEPK